MMSHHSGGKWFIPDYTHRKENKLQALSTSDYYPYFSM